MTAEIRGVATTYSPVMKPETLADVWASPRVCSSWAPPYSTPSRTPRRSSSRLIRSRGSAMRATARLAMANRTASRSVTGIRVTMSLIMKNVEPQAAVIAISAPTASSSVRDRCGPGIGSA